MWREIVSRGLPGRYGEILLLWDGKQKRSSDFSREKPVGGRWEGQWNSPEGLCDGLFSACVQERGLASRCSSCVQGGGHGLGGGSLAPLCPHGIPGQAGSKDATLWEPPLLGGKGREGRSGRSPREISAQQGLSRPSPPPLMGPKQGPGTHWPFLGRRSSAGTPRKGPPWPCLPPPPREFFAESTLLHPL